MSSAVGDHAVQDDVGFDPRRGHVEVGDIGLPQPGRTLREPLTKLVSGDCVEVNLEEIDGKATYVIVILTQDNRYVTLYIDADSGRERKLKDDGKCSDGDDKHKNKRGRGHYRHGNGKGYGHRWHCHCECTDDDG